MWSPALDSRPLFTVADVSVSTVDKLTIDGELPVRLCNYTDVYKNDVVNPDLDLMDATATAAEVRRFRLLTGDTVFTKDSETADDIGVPSFVDRSADDFVCGYHLAIARPNRARIHPKYLYWWMASREAARLWEVRASGVTRVGLRQADITHFPVPLFTSIEGQRAIADFLDRETAQIDAMIEAQRELIERLEERRAAVLLEETVSRWTRQSPVRLSWALSKLDRPVPEESGVVTAYRDGEVTLRSNRRDDGYTFSETEGGYQGVSRGDVVFHALDGFAGAVGVSDSFGKCSPVYHVCRATAGNDPVFLSHLLRALGLSGFLTAYAWSVRQRSVDYRNWSLFGALPVRLPALDDQRRAVEEISNSLARIDMLTGAASEAALLMRERRSALISAAVTGQINPRTGAEATTKKALEFA